MAVKVVVFYDKYQEFHDQLVHCLHAQIFVQYKRMIKYLIKIDVKEIIFIVEVNSFM